MNKIKDWFDIEHDVEKTIRKVIDVFEPWCKRNLVITHGKDKTTEFTFGFPYTSSGSDGAGIWNCQAEALLKENLSLRFKGLMLREDMEVIACFVDGSEGWQEIIIGKIN